MTVKKDYVMAMYDIRGIQKYIYHTPRIRDAIGASSIVENLVADGLKKASKDLHLKSELEWYTDQGPVTFNPAWNKDLDLQVLYIGGGNAVVLEKNSVNVEVNKIIARYVLDQTYSLQLAAAKVPVTESYREDYQKLQKIMEKVKATMPDSKPVGAFPVTKREIATGNPISETFYSDNRQEEVSRETLLKKNMASRTYQQDQSKWESRILDNYVDNKGEDSTIAVVHLDGNNMGKRIGSLLENKETYEEAANAMRRISLNISRSYQHVFDDMQKYFTSCTPVNHNNHYFVRKIIIAGDDITYVCTGRIALATMQYYAQHISSYAMNGEKDEKSIHDYGFSVCGGAALIHSHFPFSVAYNVAEALCDNAKDKAKRPENKEVYSRTINGHEMTFERVGNYIDFHICKNVHAEDLDEMRRKEYITSSGESLLLRPYYIPTEHEGKLRREGPDNFDNFRENMKSLKDEDGIPRSLLKEIRNTYPEGKDEMNMLVSFLKSRNWHMPDGTLNMYTDDQKTARWYDAVEMMDDYTDLDELKEDDNDETGNS